MRVATFTFRRHVEVGWSPDGKLLLINDHVGSDEFQAYILGTGAGNRKVRISDKLRRSLGASDRLFKNEHLYFDGLRWLGDDRLELRVTGYGTGYPNGITVCYEYTPPDRFRRLRSVSEAAQPCD